MSRPTVFNNTSFWHMQYGETVPFNDYTDRKSPFSLIRKRTLSAVLPTLDTTLYSLHYFLLSTRLFKHCSLSAELHVSHSPHYALLYGTLYSLHYSLVSGLLSNLYTNLYNTLHTMLYTIGILYSLHYSLVSTLLSTVYTTLLSTVLSHYFLRSAGRQNSLETNNG